MSAKEKLIAQLNEVVAWELAGVIQYLQHSVMVTGPLRESLKEFFSEGSEEARQHAETAANKIAALGGVPTVEPAKIRQAAGVEDMLEAALALEEEALAAWEKCLEHAAEVNLGTAFWIEEHVAEEQEHVDEMRKLTEQVKFSASSLSKGQSDAG